MLNSYSSRALLPQVISCKGFLLHGLRVVAKRVCTVAEGRCWLLTGSWLWFQCACHSLWRGRCQSMRALSPPLLSLSVLDNPQSRVLCTGHSADLLQSREDSNDEDMEERDPALTRRSKWARAGGSSKSPSKAKSTKSGEPGPPPSAAPYAPGWTWQPAQWMPSQPSQPPPVWYGPQPPTSGAPCSESVGVSV